MRFKGNIVTLSLSRILILIFAGALCRWVFADTQKSLDPPTGIRGEFSIAATGDSILLRPVSVYESEPGFSAIVKILREATVAFTNFEMCAFDTRKFKPTPNAEFQLVWVHGDSSQASEFKWLGFDMVSFANNHTVDYGLEGMLETMGVLDEIGIVHAGTGRTLGEARAPAYLQTPIGRVAMIACASTAAISSRAMNPRPDMKGRPGLSPLRWTRNVYLEEKYFNSLKEAVESLSGSRYPSDSELEFFGRIYTGELVTRVLKGKTNRIELVANEQDVKEIIEQVTSARRQADFVFVTIHAHEPDNSVDVPPEFLIKFARETIDAGADMFIGHGPHQLRAIEIYKGRPIFYSLGNFFFHWQTLEPQAADAYERIPWYRVPKIDILRSTPGDLFDSLLSGYGFKEAIWWESVIALPKFSQGCRLESVELHPVDLGGELPRSQRGTARKASPETAKKIIERLARLSKPFGTDIQFGEGIGVVRLKAASN